MSKGCYTCRRRRIVCDNGRPTCRKCRDAGKECLGYQKPLVWVKGGVASRGKMMGLSFDDVTLSQASPGRASTGCCSTDSPEQTEQSLCESETLPDDGNLQVQVQTLPEATLAKYYNNHGALVHVRRLPTESPSFALVDPLFQDVDKRSRLYISHFNLHCVQALCLYDKVRNPYRELIPYIGESAVLTDSLAAIGAIHQAYMFSNDYQLPQSSEPTEPSESILSLGRHPVSFSAQPTNAKAFSHFLALKQRALRQLSIDVSRASTRNDDRTVAAIFVLILLDAIESGNGAWKYHLEGAKSILRDRLLLTANHSATTEGIDTFVIDSCLITEIMGSTLARPGVLSRPFYSQSMGAAVLQRLEKTAWVGCPAYLLDAMFFVHAQRFSNDGSTPGYDYSLSFPSPATGEAATTNSPLAILRHIDAFDPVGWAGEMQAYLLLSDVSQRVALARAYKAAVYLYARRVVSMFGFLLLVDEACKDRDTVEKDLVHNLSLIRADDEHFKCTIWPTFIAGAESSHPDQRAFTLQRLYLLWNDFCSVNLQNAACVLKMMWQKQDEPCSDAGEFDWIQELDQSRTDWLFI